MQNYAYSGVWLPLVTPFLPSGELDMTAVRRLVRHYQAAGVQGLVVCGSTGEAAALDEAEQLTMLDTVLAEAGDLPVMMGLAGNHLGQVLQRLSAIAQRPVAGILAPAPYYVRPSQQGCMDYFLALAEASTIPIVLYDIPYRTGADLGTDSLLALAAHPNIVAIKDCGGELSKTLALLQDGRLQVLAGEDIQSFNILCLGGSGMIAAAAHLRPDLFIAMHQAVLKQQLDLARRIFLALTPLIQLVFAEANPGPVKAQLARQGLLNEGLRAPLTSASAVLSERLSAELRRLECEFGERWVG